jgi:small conductance mechanosensitive channel
VNDAVESIGRAAGPVLVILVVAVTAYVALRLVGRLVTRVVRGRMREPGEDPVTVSVTDVEARRRLATVTSLVDWIFRLVIIVTAGLAVLLVLDLTPVIVVILVLLAVVAVVARDVIRDYVGGVLIVLENQFSIGDWVRVGNEYGEVEALSLRRTSLRTEGGDLVTIPNGASAP